MTINTLLKKVNQNKKFNINTYDFFKPTFNVKLAESRGEIKLAQKLRYKVFFSERIKNPILNIGNFRRDSDKFDNYADHIIVTHRKSKFSKTKVIGTYRLLKQSVAEKKSVFYSCDEFNLENLLNSRIYNNMLELSRSCISQKFRNKNVLQLMWKEIHHYINKNNIDALFGTASFLNTNISKIEDQLIYLNHHHKMPDNITVSALPKYRVNIDYQKKINLNVRLFAKLPTLIKAYLKFNASIGTGAVIDNKFKTTDVFIFLPIEKINKEYVNKILD
tara:strand:+ start:2195 stop:3022 length:828 start_codon:yes stop_codon:yes gene_type:complete